MSGKRLERSGGIFARISRESLIKRRKEEIVPRYELFYGSFDLKFATPLGRQNDHSCRYTESVVIY